MVSSWRYGFVMGVGVLVGIGVFRVVGVLVFERRGLWFRFLGCSGVFFGLWSGGFYKCFFFTSLIIVRFFGKVFLVFFIEGVLFSVSFKGVIF